MGKKTIKVVLNKDIQKLGKSGEVKTISLGYARNYLLPYQAASIATPSLLMNINKQLLIKKQQEQELIAKLEKLKKSIQAIGQITINKKVGQGNTIFGSVTDKEVSEILKTALGENIEKKFILLPEIKEIGNYEISISLNHNINAQLTLQVIPE
uniref:ribosomal protein L9 n=1 Tax=Porphyridium aerugineum TaxID=2792 RepID=UPI001FCCF4ED|nr:ribosomal protein L9 [Porphyridium aerugineum]UNJ17911.1 ribosomal protein L9 [Porphyridium aerugineum]